MCIGQDSTDIDPFKFSHKVHILWTRFLHFSRCGNLKSSISILQQTMYGISADPTRRVVVIISCKTQNPESQIQISTFDFKFWGAEFLEIECRLRQGPNPYFGTRIVLVQSFFANRWQFCNLQPSSSPAAWKQRQFSGFNTALKPSIDQGFKDVRAYPRLSVFHLP